MSAAAFTIEPHPRRDEFKAEILASLEGRAQAEALWPHIAEAIDLFWTFRKNSAELFPPAEQTIAQLQEIARLAGALSNRLLTLNTDAYHEIKLHAGRPDRRVRYPLPIRDLAEAIKWIGENAEEGAKRHHKPAGRPPRDETRILLEQLARAYPGGANARGFHKFLSAVFEALSLGKPDGPLKRYRAFLAAEDAPVN